MTPFKTDFMQANYYCVFLAAFIFFISCFALLSPFALLIEFILRLLLFDIYLRDCLFPPSTELAPLFHHEPSSIDIYFCKKESLYFM